MLSEVAIRRAIAINRHPAGKAGMRKIEAQYGYPNRVKPVTATTHYPTPNRVGIHHSQTIVREVYYTAAGTLRIPIIHAHGAKGETLNCLNCL